MGGNGGVRASAEERDMAHVLGSGAALGRTQWAGRAGLGREGKARGLAGVCFSFFFLLFLSFSKRDFKSFSEIKQNKQYKIKYASA